MAKTLEVKGSNPIAENERFNALSQLNKLSDQELERLAHLAQSKKAVSYINNKWGMVKAFLM